MNKKAFEVWLLAMFFLVGFGIGAIVAANAIGHRFDNCVLPALTDKEDGR